jgi:endoglucanase
MKTLLKSLALLGLIQATPLALAYSVDNGTIYDAQNQPVQLRGVNWFGFETADHVVHGLWARNWKDMIGQMESLGFNAVRIPVCPGTLAGAGVSNYNGPLNPDLAGKNSLQILDAVLAEFDRRGFHILLDHHRLDCHDGIAELWYKPGYSEQNWINDLVLMANRYKTLPHFIGLDLKNEPHGAATWGVGNPATDWNTAAEKAATAVLSAAPDILVFVEGIEKNPSCNSATNHWWGGNLEPLECAPLAIPRDRLVLAPHVYGPDVYNQPYFNTVDFPHNLPGIWEQHFGRFADQGYAIAIGETGGRYGHGGDPKDKTFQDALVDYLIGRNLPNLFYWSWNPNSGDTGGILQDDWKNIWQDKVDLLARLWGGQANPAACSDGQDNDGDGLADFPADPGCAAASDRDEADPPPQAAACADGLDNDGDGRVDFPADPGCTAAGDTDEFDPPPAACADGLDNDGDGLADFPADPGCTEAGDADEYNAPPPPVGTNLPAKVAVTSDWGTGYCADVSIANGTAQAVDWITGFTVQGTINNLWNAAYTQAGDQVTATGLAWNKVLAPGASAGFGFCADRPATPPTAPAPGNVTAVLTIQSDWGAGYCADVSVKNTGSAAVAWEVSLAIEGQVNNLWNAVHTQTGSTLKAQGVDWNRWVPAGGTVSFGFCAAR